MFTLTNFSESPLHLLTIEDADILKKVVLHSVATALASNVLPVPKKEVVYQKYSILTYVPYQVDHKVRVPSMVTIFR